MAKQSRRSQAELARATHAFSRAKAAAENEMLDTYTSLTNKLPLDILSNGLGEALVFIKSKRNEPGKWQNEHRALYGDITSWLGSKYCPLSLPAREDLASYVVKLDGSSFRVFSLEILAYLIWLRKFTDGLKGESLTNIEST